MEGIKIIELSSYCNKELKLLAGRDNGINMREKLKLKELEKDESIKQIVINIPEYIKTMTSSYILGLVGNYISENGEIKFKEKYIFNCNDITKNNIQNAIDYVKRDIKEN